MTASWYAYLFLSLALVLFTVLIRNFKLVARVRRVLTVCQSALAVVRSRELPDSEKEQQMQAYSLAMLNLFLEVLGWTALTILIPTAVVGLGIYLGFTTYAETIRCAMNPYFIVISLFVVVLAGRFTSHGTH